MQKSWKITAPVGLNLMGVTVTIYQETKRTSSWPHIVFNKRPLNQSQDHRLSSSLEIVRSGPPNPSTVAFADGN
jgi:hypothetical protein